MLQNVYSISLIFYLKKSVLILTTIPPSSLPVCPTIYLSIVAVAAMVISGQEPVTLDSVRREVTRPFGSPLILKCNLNTTGYLWVDWYFNPSECSVEGSRTLYSKVYNRSANTSTVVPDKRKVDDKDDELIWYKNNSGATYNDSGWYFCRVTTDIPKLIVNVSVGTKLVISKYYMSQKKSANILLEVPLFNVYKQHINVTL